MMKMMITMLMTQALPMTMLTMKTTTADILVQMTDLSNITKTHHSSFPPINITPNGL